MKNAKQGGRGRFKGGWACAAAVGDCRGRPRDARQGQSGYNATRAWVTVLLAVSLGLHAEAQAGLTGHILDKVACQKDAAQTYALYVPSNYTQQKAWPVIFCFDPGARGRMPVERLQAAAEKYGYIVAGSLNSRNGPWEPNLTAISAMIVDVESHLRIDRKRVYTAGLSGGARVATQVALTGLAAGVIACSAGFPQTDDGIPGTVPFAFFGTAGIEDFNYAELKRLDQALEDRGATHRIVFFAGGHEWASGALLTQAVEWLELQAMRAGTRGRDEAFIQAQWQARIAAVPAQPAGEAWQATKAVADDFKGLVDTAEMEKKAKQLGTTREVKAWRKAQREQLEREDSLAADLNERVSEEAEAAMRKLVGDLRKQADAPVDSPERQMAKRVLAGAAMTVRENVRARFDEHAYGSAAALLELAIAMRPDQTRNYIELARARALGGDKRRAMEALQQGAAQGFSDAARVEAEPAFAKLKAEAAWPALIEKIRANPAEAAPPSRGRP